MGMVESRLRLPEWMKKNLPSHLPETRSVIRKYNLNTVCESALCPNCSECFSKKTATFMILGRICTRQCRFCSVRHGLPESVRVDEPGAVAQAAKELGLNYVVITSVTRDDLPHQGADQFAATISAIRSEIPLAGIEVLTPDFNAREDLLAQVVDAEPHVFNHNLETVKRLQSQIRPSASYERSLKVLATVKRLGRGVMIKSGLMVGLGETEDEIIEAAGDLRRAGCEIVTVGQYLAPSEKHWPVAEFKSENYFDSLAEELAKMDFLKVYAGAGVRSSYHADTIFKDIFVP
jgi:lipoic acid synthetase